jgi:hypothetical protein
MDPLRETSWPAWNSSFPAAGVSAPCRLNKNQQSNPCGLHDRQITLLVGFYEGTLAPSPQKALVEPPSLM